MTRSPSQTASHYLPTYPPFNLPLAHTPTPKKEKANHDTNPVTRETARRLQPYRTWYSAAQHERNTSAARKRSKDARRRCAGGRGAVLGCMCGWVDGWGCSGDGEAEGVVVRLRYGGGKGREVELGVWSWNCYVCLRGSYFGAASRSLTAVSWDSV
jgi:hypothetical protein